MHILYIHQHFATPNGCTGTRSYEFARRWLKTGHKVTLITGYYDIGGLKPGKGLIRKQIIEGINVVVVGTMYSNRQSYLRRIASFLCFILLSIYAGMRTKGVDVIYATSTPLTVGVAAIVIKWAKRVPFVFEVRDQWPEIPIEMGIITNKAVIKSALWLEKTIYKYSDGIIACSPGMAEGVREVMSKAKLQEKPIAVIPNFAETKFYHPDIDGSAVRKEKGWGDKLVFLHAGAMGKVNNLDFVIDAAVRLRDNPQILFVLLGDGSQKSALKSRIKKLELTNVEILPPVPKRQLPEILAAVDVGLVIIANFPILEHNSANKFFDTLSAGKPVFLNYSGWQRKILEENEAGFGCDLCNLDEFVEKVLYLNSHREKVLEMGQNARQIALKEFNRDMLASRLLELLKKFGNNSKAGEPHNA